MNYNFYENIKIILSVFLKIIIKFLCDIIFTVFQKSNNYIIKSYFNKFSTIHESTKINGTTVNGLFTSESFFEGYGKVVLFAQAGKSRISFGNIYKEYLADKTIIRRATKKEILDIPTKEMFIIYHDFGGQAELSAWMMSCIVSATLLKNE